MLKLLMVLAAALGAVMSRQMEYNADAYMTRFCGSPSVAEVHRALAALSLGFPLADEEAAELFKREKKLPDDLASLAAHHARSLTPESTRALELAMSARSGLFDSHPGTADRISAAERRADPGILRGSDPASSLFADFPGAAKKASFAHYKPRIGGFLYDATFVPTAKLLKGRAADLGRRGIALRVLGFQPPTWRPLFPPLASLPRLADPRPALEKLKAARASLRSAAPAAAKAADDFRETDERRLRCQQAIHAIDAGVGVDLRALGLGPLNRNALNSARDDAHAAAESASAALDPASKLAELRLGAALALLGCPALQPRFAAVERRRERVNQLLAVLAALKEALPAAQLVREATGKGRVLAGGIESQKTLDAAKVKLRPLSDNIRDSLDQVRRLCGAVPYPLADSEPVTNLGEHLVKNTPGWRQLDEIFDAGSRFLDRFASDHARALDELIEECERIEKELATPATPAPASNNPGSPNAPQVKATTPAR